MAKNSDQPRDYRVGTLSAAQEALDRSGQRDMWSLGDLVRKVGQPKSRVFRFLRTFEKSGRLTRDEVSGDCKPGPSVAPTPSTH